MDLKQCDKKQLKEEFDRLTALTSYKSTMGVFDIFTRLPELLNNGETVLCVNSGLVKSNIWLIIPTNKRVIFLHKKSGLFHKKIDSSSVNYDAITSIDSSSGLAGGKIKINTPGTIYEVGTLQKNSVQPLVDIILSTKNNSSQQPSNNSGGDDLLSKLEKLGKLKESGVLTEEEFQEQKSKLLNL
ncbi:MULTISPECIES: PH domain-containing protein [Gammaproteobacteria]|uniref:PH domain-containing protein n=1 Tax=Gammaproteobacteria TaxID=1236 RepID=UPI0018674ECA|nr:MULTISPECIES: PH domain-containing protein [Gammaproteobacteria]